MFPHNFNLSAVPLHLIHTFHQCSLTLLSVQLSPSILYPHFTKVPSQHLPFSCPPLSYTRISPKFPHNIFRSAVPLYLIPTFHPSSLTTFTVQLPPSILYPHFTQVPSQHLTFSCPVLSYTHIFPKLPHNINRSAVPFYLIPKFFPSYLTTLTVQLSHSILYPHFTKVPSQN
jgi:hypothetical protein